MAEIESLIYKIGGDNSAFLSSIEGVKKKIKEFRASASTASAKELPELNLKISQLSESLKNLQSVGTPASQAFNKIADNAKGARIALTDVSRIAQDLPFGFIGIQNNIPQLVQSFSNLKAQSGGLGGALKSLGQSLVGPAGIFLAFSVVTSAITVAVQKYGSLGGAIDALFGKTNALSKVTSDAAKSQKELNDSFKTNEQIIAQATGSTDAQITKVKLLSSTVADLTKSEDLRKNALSELQKIDKAYFGQITTGIGDVSKLEEATRKYTDAILANAVAKGFEEKFTQGAINLEEQRNLLAQIGKEYDDISKKRKGKQAEFVLFTGGKPIKETELQIAKLNETFNSQKIVVDAAIKSQDKLKESFNNATLSALGFVEPLEEGAKKAKDYKYQIDELIGALSFKTEIQNVKDLADTILDVNKKYSERKIALQELQTLGNGTFKSLSIEKSGFDNLKDAIDTYIHLLQTLDLENKGRVAALKLQEQALKNTAKAAEELTKKEQDLFNAINKEASGFTNKPMDAKVIGKTNLDQALKSYKDFADGAEKITFLLTDVFYNPLNEMFTTLFTKFNFSIKDFTQSILKSIGQIAAKLATTLVVQGLISLFSAPLAFGGAFSADGALGFLGKAIDSISKPRNANFNGVQGGGTAMSGEVSLVLRGTDLVGSINRTNSQISRVG